MCTYREVLSNLVSSMTPFDTIESKHQEEVLDWIRSDKDLWRKKELNDPIQHLVSYALVMDPKNHEILLVDHKRAKLWLPTGGHVDEGEFPKESALRELSEELNVELPLLYEKPFFLTVNNTGGSMAHVDVSFWYIFSCTRGKEFQFDPTEFHSVCWFPFDKLPYPKVDPHIERFIKKYMRK